MRALYVHGMGRSPISGWPMRVRLQQHGYEYDSFPYMVSLENFEAVRQRLVHKLCQMAELGNYVVIGHSLGGVLLRAALASMPAEVPLPRRLFLIGSPVAPSRLAKALRKRWLYRALTGDCGQLLASSERMQQVPAAAVPTIAIVGNRGIKGKWTPFGDEDNDGIVAISEVLPKWEHEIITLPVIHALQPSSWIVADVIARKLDDLHKAHPAQM